MEKGKTRFLVPLVTLCLLLIGASSVSAQTVAITYQITSTPTFVINTGRSEVLGAVRITSQIASAANSIATTTEFLYENTGCDNNQTNGIGVLATGGLVTAALASVTNTSAGCVVSVTVPVGLTVAVGNFIEVRGVRGRVDLSPAGAPSIGVDISARLNATPSGSALFTAPSIVRVATSAVGLTATIRNGIQLFCVLPPPNPTPRVRVTEGFNGAFVHHVTSAAGTAAPADHRPGTGVCTGAPDIQGCGTNNTQIQILIADIPTGIVLTWPAAVAGVNISTGLASAGSLQRISTTATATTQVYEFVTTSQGASDINTEQFDIIPTVALPAALVLGTATAQVHLWPGLITGDATSVTTIPFGAAVTAGRPRFNDPLIPVPPGALLTLNPCTTNLLFPFTANVAGFDTGIAIANTSSDDAPFPGVGAAPQFGTCTLYGYTAATGTLVTYTTPSLATGTTFLTTLSSANNPAYNGFVGYIIARCNFQFGHGFAFISDGFGGGGINQAQGYLALIIPDPFIVPLGRRSQSPIPTVNEGEGLGQ